MNAPSASGVAATPRAVVSGLVTLLEIEYATLIVESRLFLDQVETIYRGQRVLVALDETRTRVDQLLLERARHRCASPNNLAVFCYAWALNRLAAGRALAVMNWSTWSASPIDLSGYRVASLVLQPRR